MSIVLVGLNHKTAPVDLREKLAFSEADCSHALRNLVDGEAVREALIVSTCNRVEVVGSVSNRQTFDITKRITWFLGNARSIPESVFRAHTYSHFDDDAVRHLFRVASSLDSMVVGEPQILGQVRQAYATAVEAGTAGRVLNRLVHQTLRVAKRIRTETGIAASAVSISYMAVELGRKIFGDLTQSTVLLVGAGEMAELSARHLLNAGVKRLLVSNRTLENTYRIAEKLGAEAVNLPEMPNRLHEADIIICSTGAPEYLIKKEMARAALEKRRNRPAFYIDISVPRNIDPAVGRISNLFLFDIDDLEAVIASNIREREREAQRAELIVDAEVLRFQQSLRNLKIGPTLGALKKKLDDIAGQEFDRHRTRLGPLTPEQEAAVHALLSSTVSKIAHPVLTRMRRSYDTGDEENIRAWRDVFGLEAEDHGEDDLD
jgi:glutamyl-tRNA reductase